MNWSKALLAVVSLFVFLFWLYVPSDEITDDRFIVTFSYDCREVIDDEDVPEHVMEECRKIMKEIEDDRPTI